MDLEGTIMCGKEVLLLSGFLRLFLILSLPYTLLVCMSELYSTKTRIFCILTFWNNVGIHFHCSVNLEGRQYSLRKCQHPRTPQGYLEYGVIDLSL